MRRFSILVAGALINSVGSGMTAFALGAWAFTTFGTASAVALVQLCAFAPMVMLGPVAGSLADRHDRRTIMILGDGGSALGLLVVLVALSRPTPSLPLVLAGVTLSSCLASLTEPALRATVNDLVPSELYTRSSSMLQLAASSKFLLSPFLAGLLMPRLGVAGILWIDISTVVVTVCCTLYVRRLVGAKATPTRDGSPLAGLRETAGLLAGRPAVASAIGLASLLTVILGVLQVLLGPVLLPNYPVSAVGTAQSVAATGMLVGAAAVSQLGRVRPAFLLGIGVLGVGVGMSAQVASASLAWVSGCCFLVFASLAQCNTGAEIIVRTSIPGEHQGRAWGLIGLLSQMGFLVAYLLAGPTADHVFEPLLRHGGALAHGLGPVTGIGPGRGTALLIAVCGLGALALIPAALSPQMRAVPATQKPATQKPATRKVKTRA
ncbi:MFS transporter [Actinomyces oricola]